MQDLASQFSKFFPGVIPPDPHSGWGDPSQVWKRPGVGPSAPVLGPKPWSSSTFQPWLRPCVIYIKLHEKRCNNKAVLMRV